LDEEEKLETDLIDYNSSKSPFSVTKECDLIEIEDKTKRKKLLTSLYPIQKYEVEVITPFGSFWGDLLFTAVNASTYLYFKARGQKLEDLHGLDDLKYNFRSMDDLQKDEDLEILMDVKKVEEVIATWFLNLPIAVEMFYKQTNRTYFFNFFQENNRDVFLKE
jgi:hypothetical protein